MSVPVIERSAHIPHYYYYNSSKHAGALLWDLIHTHAMQSGGVNVAFNPLTARQWRRLNRQMKRLLARHYPGTMLARLDVADATIVQWAWDRRDGIDGGAILQFP